MVVLLDTHYLIWALDGDARLNTNALAIVRDPMIPVRVSIVSYWEIAIKLSVGKLKIRSGFEALVSRTRELGIELLPLTTDHVALVKDLPLHHRDPFDRMIISQAKHEGLRLLTADPVFKLYDVQLIDL